MHGRGHGPGATTSGPVVAAVLARGGAVEVVASSARSRSSSAAVRRGRVVVRVPAHLPPAGRAEVVDRLVARLEDRASAPAPRTVLPPAVPPRPTRAPVGPRGDTALVARADAVATRWLADHGVAAEHVGWSHRMWTRWASCTTPVGRVRVSHRLADAPDEVLDVLLLHELAHVVHAGHGPAFRALAARHPALPEVDAWLAARTHRDLRRALALD